jgi:crotonobetainyl-CoA:carnitine CoA-transferase CaiB-like acyl-CoA transferase
VYQTRSGVLQAAPAPRFSAYPDVEVADVPAPGSDWRAIMTAAGMAAAEADAWVSAGVVNPPA